MTQEETISHAELDDILTRLDSSKGALIAVLEASDPEKFNKESPDGETVKHSLERTADDINFYYGRLVARALNLPQPPCLQGAEFGSLIEGTMALQVAHRRFTNLLHDLVPGDLDKVAEEPELGRYTLRQLLEMAAAQYNLRASQVKRLAGPKPRQRRA